VQTNTAVTFRIVVSRIAAVLLWLGSFVLGIIDVLYIRSIFDAIFLRFSNELKVGTAVEYFLVFIAAIGCLVFVVVTGEYHMKHAGTTSSWKLFAVSYIVLVAIPIINVIIA
jgi:hypothetical protein